MGELQFYSELPSYSRQVEKIDLVAKLTEKYDFTGTLIYYFQDSYDPWMLANRILQQTEHLVPLIATQPFALPPFTVAKMVKSIYGIYGRKVNLNFITGVMEKELISVNESIDNKPEFRKPIKKGSP